MLFFSLAFNIGFFFTAANRKMRPGPGPILKILDGMDLPEELRGKVTDTIKQLDTDHWKFRKLLSKEERKILDLMGRPGNLDMDMVAPLIESYSQISKKSALNKAGYIIEIRKLLGSEKSLYLISEMKKNFEKRMCKDKPQG